MTLKHFTTRSFVPGCIMVTDSRSRMLVVTSIGPKVRGDERSSPKEWHDDAEHAAFPGRAYREGRAQREKTTRTALATLVARPETYDPVARLMWQGDNRVKQLLPIRYQRMLASPLSFYRGGAL